MDRVDEIAASVTPSNPGYREQWRPVDEELQELDAEEMTVKYSLKGNSNLDIPETGLLSRLIAMVADGYGSLRAKGVFEGAPVQISSKEQPKTITLSEDVAVDPLPELAKKLKAIAAEQTPYEKD